MGDVPATVGPYRIVRPLGEGGMGVVFEALHESIQRRVAIKTLKPDYAKSKESLARFFNEARAVNIIRHPGIVSISDMGSLPDGAAYIVMEYLEGETLRQLIKQGLTNDDSLRIGRQIAAAMHAAHEKGIVHRDLKPDNVMLVSDSDVVGGRRAKILDFGIAKLAAEYRDPGQPDAQTGTGVALGTPTYMSPEQCRGDRSIDHRTDVYALGCMLYEMIAGRRPFQAGGWGAMVAMQIYESPPPLREHAPGCSAELAELVHRMLTKDPDARPVMREVLERLDALIGALPAEITKRTVAQSDAPPGLLVSNQVPPVTTLGGATGVAQRRSRGRLGLGVLAAGGLLVLGTFLLWSWRLPALGTRSVGSAARPLPITIKPDSAPPPLASPNVTPVSVRQLTASGERPSAAPGLRSKGAAERASKGSIKKARSQRGTAGPVTAPTSRPAATVTPQTAPPVPTKPQVSARPAEQHLPPPPQKHKTDEEYLP